MLNSIQWQRGVNQQLSALLQQVAEHPAQAGLSLLAFSALYGVLHALGPGHGKVVIATWLATHPSRLKTGLWLTLSASLLQGAMAIALVTVVLTLLQLPARQLHLSGFWLEKGSYLLVGALGLLLCWRALVTLKTLLRPAPRFTRFTTAAQPHQHDERCGCGHQHVPDDARLAHSGSVQARVAIVLSMGLRPCSGALMVLLFSKVIGVYGWGMAATMAMALGTSLTISALALLVHSFRAAAVRLSQQRAPALWQRVGGATLALSGGVILLIAAVVMWLSALPPGGGLRPF